MFSHDYMQEWAAGSLTLSLWKYIQTKVGCPKIDILPLPPVSKEEISTEKKQIQAAQNHPAPYVYTYISSCAELCS